MPTGDGRRFAGKVAIVTGSTADPSIGRSCAARLARDGTSVDDLMARQGWGPMAPAVRDGAIAGPPSAAVEQIQRYIDAGADGVNVALRAPWDDAVLDAYLEQLPVFRKLS